MQHFKLSSCALAATIFCALVTSGCSTTKQTSGINQVPHEGTQWPLLVAQRAALKQSARMSGWAQEAERRGVWNNGEMLPIPAVPDFGFSVNDTPQPFSSGNLIPPPPVTAGSDLGGSAVRTARMSSLHDCALTYGVRAGMRKQMANIKEVLKRDDVAQMLDNAFDFGPVMLTRYLVPPSVTESRDEFEQEGAQKLRLREAHYRVIAQARFTSVKPNWRGFMHQIVVPNDERSPCSARSFDLTGAEQSWWSEAEKKAILHGVEAANAVFTSALERLENQHTGMMKYHEWVWRGMLGVPHISQSDYNLWLDGRRQDARLNERLLRITDLPSFTDDRNIWNGRAPHTEESKRVASDLALPVCHGNECRPEHLAVGGLRHASSEEYFIHPTLRLRGGGGHHPTRASAAAVQRPRVSYTTHEAIAAQAIAKQQGAQQVVPSTEQSAKEPVKIAPNVAEPQTVPTPSSQTTTPVTANQVKTDKVVDQTTTPVAEQVFRPQKPAIAKPSNKYKTSAHNSDVNPEVAAKAREIIRAKDQERYEARVKQWEEWKKSQAERKQTRSKKRWGKKHTSY